MKPILQHALIGACVSVVGLTSQLALAGKDLDTIRKRDDLTITSTPIGRRRCMKPQTS